ncbi:hypothetical protein [Nakamurella endophytica]|uniref:Glycoside hydrolase family 42 N-terminal domain-containing protein n=1 Tax=Nakamurella endophytica TaxID=1748367 RepID=A0A917WBG6_9ACTN|nr:hypothetical protein [Nakamurella endophytica]GGL91447.1 hypothetical protein GCM10011594_09030 [Nakamurella endophytica]
MSPLVRVKTLARLPWRRADRVTVPVGGAEASAGRAPSAGRGARWRNQGVAVAVAAVAAVALVPATPAAAAPAMFLGTLGTSAKYASTESAAGVKVAMLELNWSKYEPRPGVFDTQYEKIMRSKLTSLQAAGMRVTLGLGLHYTPSWIFSVPNSRFVDQYGRQSKEANLVFNQQVRGYANLYLARIGKALHYSSFWAVRVTSGSRSEVMYPSGGQYWAFDRIALTGVGLPSTLARNPFPSWRPGRAGLSRAQVNQWAEWYVGALADAANWQAGTVRHNGFRGYFQIVTPGVGVQPKPLAALVARNLPNGTLGVGAAWEVLYRKLSRMPNRVAMISSVGDGSHGNVGCTATDRSVPLDSTATYQWSSTRWISRVADQYGFLKAGENPGMPGSVAGLALYRSTASTGLMAVAVKLSRSCGFQGLYWAHDDNFWNGNVSFSRYAANTTPSAVLPAAAPRV